MKLYQLRSKVKNFFAVVISDPFRKSLPKITYEYTKLFFTNRLAFDQYFDKFLYRKGRTNFRDYKLPDSLLYKIWKVNDPVYIPILDNKYLFEKFFAMNDIRVVKSYARNNHSMFFINDHVEQINEPEFFAAFLKKLIEEQAPTPDIFIKKNSASCGGKGIYRVSLTDLENDKAKIEKIFHNVMKSEFLFQERLIQHDDFNKLNPHCINSIRIDTYTDRKNISRVISSFVRMGVNKSHVDNISSGGVFAGVDPAKGVLYAEAYSNFTDGKAMTCTVHPDTGTRFEGFRVPLYREAEELALKAARCIAQVRLVGWDVAITPDGPVLIEGNDTPGMSASEIAVDGYKDNPVLKDLVDEVIERKL